MSSAELPKAECVIQLRKHSEFEKIKTKKPTKNENPEYSKLAWEYTNTGTSRTLH